MWWLLSSLIPFRSATPLRHRLWRLFYDRFAFAYDAVLDWADQLHISSERRIRRDVIGGLTLPVGAFVLDVGCGTAANLDFLPADISYIGVDLSASMLQIAKARVVQKRVAHLVQAEGVALPFRKSFATLVIAMGVLQHVAEPQKATAQLGRVASKGAQLLIIDERRAADRILPADEPAQARKIGEYFVVSLRKD